LSPSSLASPVARRISGSQPLQPSGGQPQDKIPQFGATVPLGRPGQPAELASVYVHLASQESSYVTGEVYGVTGGNHLP
jgi:NAD(P)-dependent dehydrogenase (short-subunit alcohol dehydrogenase family)